MSKVKIAVIDSNVNIEHSFFENIDINIIDKFDWVENKEYGHGTAVCGEIINECRDVLIDIYPVFGPELATETDVVIDVLEYINQHEKYDIINMSIAMFEMGDSSRLSDLCNALNEKGTVIVAAYDNWGGMSYPACFTNVIGVDIGENIANPKDYIYIENEGTDIVCSNKSRGIVDSKGKIAFSYGTSFCTAYISGKIAQYIYENNICSLAKVKEYLKKNAMKEYEFSCEEIEKIKAKKVVVFPCNKEIITCVKLADFATCDIEGIYDLKYSSNVGKHIVSYTGSKEYTVRNIEKLDWNGDWDTLVIGHIDKYLHVLPKGYIDKILNMCKEKGKRIYCFDDKLAKLYPKYEENIQYPRIDKGNIPYGNRGKMWNIDIPVLAIAGTSPQIGKFSAQVQIVNKIKEKSYNPAFISTEPSGYLFGSDIVFPYGYNATFNFTEEEVATTFNKVGHDVVRGGDKDILIYGTQSGLIPINMGNVNQLTSRQNSILFGIVPDAVVLCVSPNDEIEFISRNICMLSSTFESEVIAILVSPVQKNVINGMLVNQDISDRVELRDFAVKIEEITQIKTMIMNDVGLDNAVSLVIDYFVGEN